MARYWAVAHSNPSEGREEEYNDWYWNEHLEAILAIPGVISGQRFTAAAQQFGNALQPFKYLAVYELETDDPQKFIQEMISRVASGRMSQSTTLAPGATLVIWQLMSPPRTAT
jgi:hypothetical protein